MDTINRIQRAVDFITAGNEPSGCVGIHLANAARIKNPVSLLRGL